MNVRLNPAKLLLWRNPTSLQIGLENPLVLEDVTLEQERLLALLDRGMADEAIEPEARGLIDRLEPALLGGSSIVKPTLNTDFIRGAFAELIRASYATNLDGIAVLENRAKVTVHIDSLGLGGSLIVLGLAACGIGRILTSDTEAVGEHDLGPLGYETDSRGLPRIDALNDLLAKRVGSARVFNFDSLTPAKARHSLRVLVGQNAIAPARYLQLDTAHIGVFFGTDSVSVSPKITGSPCLGCLDLWRTEVDSNWPVLASQLIGRNDYLEDARSALFVASMVVGEIVRAIDSPNQENEFLGHRLNNRTGVVEPWSWQKHPACSCG